MLEYSQYPEATNDSIEIDVSPPGADADELQDPDEEEIRPLNRRSDKGLYVIMAIIAALATSALAVSSTLLVQINRNRSLKAAKLSANPPPPSPPGESITYPPSFRGTNVERTQQNITSSYKGDDTLLAGTTSNGTITGIGLTVNVTNEVGVPTSTQSPGNSFIPPESYPPATVDDIAEDPTTAPTPVSTEIAEAVTAPPTPEPTKVVTASPTSDPTTAVTALPTPGPTEAVTAPPTPEPTKVVTASPTSGPTKAVTALPTPAPTDAVTTTPTPEPTKVVTASPTSDPTKAVSALPTPGPTDAVTAPPTPEPTEIGTTTDSTPVPTGAVITTVPTQMSTPSTSDASFGPGKSSSCVNIKFTSSKAFPEENGFTFLSTKSGEVLYQEDAGFMEEPQSEYLQTFCNLSPGSYTLVVTDTSGDGMFADGGGSYVVDIDGQVILVGGRFRTKEISHEIIVGINAMMSETDQGFLDAHNLHRKEFHENQEVSFRPMAWSAELAAGASAWAKEKAKTCSNNEGESGPFGQNASSQRLLRPDLARSPEMIVGWWMNGFDPEALSWGATLRPGGAVLWRTALYVGCAAEIAPIENCPETQRACFCQVTNCRYSRTTNCAVRKDDWLNSVLDDNGQLCNSVFCPGADENGTIVEGACHV